MSAKPEARVLLEDLVESETPAAPAGPLVGEVLEAEHPTLQGRARVRWSDDRGEKEEAWLPCLQGLTVRARDRVLVQRASNWPEAIVVGVLDGFARRPEAPVREAARLRLRADETLTVSGEDEQPLLELRQEAQGTRVRLLREDVDVEMPGRLRLAARELELRARSGDVRIRASDDVRVDGEAIRLN